MMKIRKKENTRKAEKRMKYKRQEGKNRARRKEIYTPILSDLLII
jgi:hypothetical protein